MKIVVILCNVGGGWLRASCGDGLPGVGQPTLRSETRAVRRQPRSACPAGDDHEEGESVVRGGAVLREETPKVRPPLSAGGG